MIRNDEQIEESESAMVGLFEDRNYTGFYNDSKFGYQWKEEEKSWIKPDDKKIDVVEEVFDLFIEYGTKKPYEKILNRLNGIPDDFDRRKLKNLLTDPIYIGVATANAENISQCEYDELCVYDPNLKIVPNELFYEVQQKIEGMKRESRVEEGDEPDVRTFKENNHEDVIKQDAGQDHRLSVHAPMRLHRRVSARPRYRRL